MKFEHYSEPILPKEKLIIRILHSFWLALIVIFFSLGMGMIGYHTLGNLSWVDSLLEASMILGGMGAIAPMKNDSVKIFASFYALFSGLVLITTSGIILAPFLHRLLHKFHKEKK